MQVGFGFRLHALGHLVEHVGRLVNPAALLACLREDLAKSRPEAQCTVADRDLRSRRQAALLQVQQQLAPALFAFAVAIEHRDQFLLAIGRGAHQHQQTLLFVGIVFQSNLGVNAIGPDVNVMLSG